jgi:hypothetical protein
VKREITTSVRAKILEAIERTIHLVRFVPVERLDWRPVAGLISSESPVDLGHLLGHLLDCVAGFCAVFQAAYPSELREFDAFRNLEVNHSCRPEDAAARLENYSKYVLRGFEFCVDEDLPRKIHTAFVSGGEPLITLLLGNLEHLTNHKYQLFFYLKLLGLPVGSADIYHFRGDS